MKIAIIGAGAAGGMLAWRLAQAGMAPEVFERDEHPGAANPCGGAVVYAYAAKLRLPDEVIDQRINRIKVYYKRRSKEWEFAVPILISFRRAIVDRFVMERASEAGAVCHTGASVRGFDPATGTLTVASRKVGNNSSHHADLLVNASGSGRAIAGVAGGNEGRQRRCVAVYAELEGDLEPPGVMEFHLDGLGGKPGYFWVFPKKGRVNVGVGWLSECGVSSMWAVLEEFIRNRPELRDRKMLRRHGGSIPVARAPRVTSERCLALGDAAGLVNPFTGGGLVYAQHSAELAARAILGSVGAGQTADQIIRAYELSLRHSPHWNFLRLIDVPYRLLVRRSLAGHEKAFSRGALGYFTIMSAAAQVMAEYRYRFPGAAQS